jgi:photosystem II stability/assembly factor-like uncharacterized protein
MTSPGENTRNSTRNLVATLIFGCVVAAVLTLPARGGEVSLWVAGGGGTILHSTGDGVWTPQVSGTTAHLTSIDFVDPLHGWAGGGQTGDASVLRQTVDGGVTWTTGGSLPGNINYNALAFADSQNGWAGGNPSNAKLFHTTDGGMTWTLQLNAGFNTVYDIVARDANTAWSAQGGGVYRTTDGGASWDHSTGLSNGISISFPTATDGWAVSDQNTGVKPRILVTHDGGATFTTQLVSADPVLDGRALSNLFFSDAQNGWAVGSNGTIIHTSDGGMTWVDQSVNNNSADFADVIFADSLHGWAVGGTYIYGTSDGGLDWTPELTSGYPAGFTSITLVRMSSVPEPGTFLLLASGALVILGSSALRKR